MRTVKIAILFSITILTFVSSFSQDRYRVMFYNVENLFDPFKDSLTNDGEFTPQGSRYWTWKRMTEKLNNIYRVVTAVGEWDLPSIVGFCEVENSFVMYQLINKTPLSKFDYRLVHKESPDGRGIDVALIYRPDRFKLEEKRFFRVINPDEPKRTTRDVLYARGILGQLDTIHIFVNHWPSKFGGELASEPGRLAAGRLVREKVDSIRIFSPQARIIIMGDFNDGPNSPPLLEALRAEPPKTPYSPKGLYNLHHRYDGSGTGTIKFQGAWEVIDMMIVSKSLLDKSHPIYLNPDGGMIFQADFLKEEDTNFVGFRPFRTYIGFKYHGGFSDHFPIYIDIFPNR
jgi:predicted extracellular nuclease